MKHVQPISKGRPVPAYVNQGIFLNALELLLRGLGKYIKSIDKEEKGKEA